MSPEIHEYFLTKKEEKTPATKKAEEYPVTRSWGVTTNKRISVAGVWRK